MVVQDRTGLCVCVGSPLGSPGAAEQRRASRPGCADIERVRMTDESGLLEWAQAALVSRSWDLSVHPTRYRKLGAESDHCESADIAESAGRRAACGLSVAGR